MFVMACGVLQISETQPFRMLGSSSLVSLDERKSGRLEEESAWTQLRRWKSDLMMAFHAFRTPGVS